MRRALILLTLVAVCGCRRTHPPIVGAVEEAPAPAPLDLARPAPSAAVFASDAPATAGEIRGAVSPHYAEIGRCIAATGTAATLDQYTLTFVIEPSGQLGAVGLRGLPQATPCVQAALKDVRLRPHTGAPVPAETTFRRDLPQADGGA